MNKIEEARRFLQMIGMPKAQQADICCYVLLAMNSLIFFILEIYKY